MTNECSRERLSVAAASDSPPAFTAFRINPGYSVDYQKCANVVTHGAPPLDNSALAASPSLLFRFGYHSGSDMRMRCVSRMTS